MNIRTALAHGRTFTGTTEARLLLQYVLKVSHSYLIAHATESLTAAQQTHYAQLLERAGQHEPIPYIIGQAPFYGRDFHVTPAVLIPRPDTEFLVDQALTWARRRRPQVIVDVGSGSGCIPITLSLELMSPPPLVIGVDISTAALQVANQNAQRQRTAVQFVRSDLLSAIDGPLQLITANLPYITDAEWTRLDDGVKSYEPALALRGGADGLDLVRKLLTQAAPRLQAGGLLLLEIGWQQGQTAVQLASQAFPQATIHMLQDYAGHDRLVHIQV